MTADAWAGRPGDGLRIRPQDRVRDGSVVTIGGAAGAPRRAVICPDP